MPTHEEQHNLEETSETGKGMNPDVDADVDNVLASIEQELSALVDRCEQTTAQHARELSQRQAEIDRTIQIALKRQVEIDRQTAKLRSLADEVVQAEADLTERKRKLAERLRRRRARMDTKMTASVDAHAQRAAQELEARAEELAQREAEQEVAAQRANEQAETARLEMARLQEVRQLIDEQASMTAEHAQAMEAQLAKRDQASLELLERLREACGLADRVRELSTEVREGRVEVRESLDRAEHAERERVEARSSLEAARARIAQLESSVQDLSREKLLHEQRAMRTNSELQAREAAIAKREQQLREEAQRLAEDQAACDAQLRELGQQLVERDRADRARRLDPRTPQAISSLPIPATARRRPGLRLAE
ncbi:MAG: hypothetical protein ACIAS6_13420 [Phycisphaerales bacterium JB060]